MFLSRQSILPKLLFLIAVDATRHDSGEVPRPQEMNLMTPSIGVRGTAASGKGLQTAVTPECTQGYVNCQFGTAADGSGRSCTDACEGQCCVGSDACLSFSGQVCKNGSSCIGTRACAFAKIPFVMNGCKGEGACLQTAQGFGGKIGNVVNSCNANSACEMAGYPKYDRTGVNTGIGAIDKDLTNCCNTQYACIRANNNKLPPACTTPSSVTAEIL